jgi:hypothetical protein
MKATNMNQSDKYELPRETVGDHAHMLFRGLLGAIPVAGQAAIEFFQTVITPPLTKRRIEWMNEVAEGLRELEERQKCVLDELKDNDTFVDTVLHASQAALRTSRQEKRNALRNAVLNSALPNPPEDSFQQMFIDFVDSFSALHLQLLAFLDDPNAWYGQHGRTPPDRAPDTLWQLVSKAFPHLNSEEILCERVCMNLHESGLLIASSLRKRVSRFPYFPKRPREEQPGYKFTDELPGDSTAIYSGRPTSLREWTTEVGRQFLAFVTAPSFDSE